MTKLSISGVNVRYFQVTVTVAHRDCQVHSCCYFATLCLETFGPSSKDLSLHGCPEHVSHRRLRAPESACFLMLVLCHEKIQIKPGRQFKFKRLLSMVLQ